MKFAVLLFNQNLIMLFYLLIGYFLVRRKLVGLQGSSDIARILLYIVMPTAILIFLFPKNPDKPDRFKFPRRTTPFYPAVLPPGNHQRSDPYTCFHERTAGNDRPRDLPCTDSIEITLERPHRI